MSTVKLAGGSATEFAPIEQILERLKAGEMVIMVDDEDRENEGDLIMLASQVTP